MGEISSLDAELVVLGRLEALSLTGGTERDVDQALLQVDETRVSPRVLGGVLHQLVQKGEASVEGSYTLRVFVISEKGRARLRGGRS